ncbi:hypothetical protein DMC14_002515 [Metamycoplasma phocicerebrale]|uniref:Uncharacterized protein n=1 Tax=Metamycoplasma phocicerebrale TaxID=142649 RepID=A0A3T0TUD7_9BACT|nr:hypothetical protein [Metamycoplasma phocicerebrale]AZZ65644.1 hypothetical protein DMC14_002515 [Metamycoplasma phocicerebrale]
MIKIKNLQSLNIIDYEGIFIIETENIDNLLLSFYQYEINNKEEVFCINKSNISIKNTVLISPLTKLSDLYNLSTKNILTKWIVNNDKLDINNIFITNKILEELEKLNNIINSSFLDINLDKMKMLKNLITIDEDAFIDIKSFEKWLINFDSSTKPLIILKNTNLMCSTLIKYINKFNFLIITNNIFSIIDQPNQIECCSIEKNNKLITFESFNTIKMWLEEEYKLNNFSDDDYFNILKEDKFKQLMLKKQLF